MRFAVVRRRDGIGLIDEEEGVLVCRLDFGSPYGDKLMALESAARALVRKLKICQHAYMGFEEHYKEELAALEAALGEDKA